MRLVLVQYNAMDAYDLHGQLNSVDPPTKYLTNGPWIYLVPQFKPESVLMLGFAGGTVAGLIRKLYGNDIPITAVDIENCEPKYDVKFIRADAREYVKTCGKFDVVIIDLFPDDSPDMCDFVLTKDFVEDIQKIANYIILNTLHDPDLSAYKIFRARGFYKPNKCANKIYYFSTREIHNLFVK